MGLTKPTNLSHIPCMSKSSDTSPKPSHYLAVKFAGGKVIHCELKPLLNFHEDDFSKKLEKGWCVLCDLRPLEKKVGAAEIRDGGSSREESELLGMGSTRWTGSHHGSLYQTDLVGLGLGCCGTIQLCLHVLAPHRWLCILCFDQEGFDV